MNKLVFVIAIFLSGSLMATDCCKSSSDEKDPACEQTSDADQSTMNKMDGGKEMEMNEGDVYYTCPMEAHKYIKSDKPGNCPECGMALIPVKSKGQSTMNKMGDMKGMKGMKGMEGMKGMIMKGMKMKDMKMENMKNMKGMQMNDDAVVYYTCPMEAHKNVHSSEPGNCPECGMALVGVEVTTEAEAEFYGCTMESHSFVRSDKPGTCPECGMALKPMRLKK